MPGDGFYEQKLIRDQVLALTGNRYLGDYQSDEQQYMALMNSGLTYARQWNLRPGIALSNEQMAQLSSDMVWLVNQDITLADGSVQSVLVPQVYVRVKPGDLDGSGALIAGKDINMNLSGELSNSSGTIAGRNVMEINAKNINNLGGTLTADTLSASARQDLNNIAGEISGIGAVTATAGRDLNITSTTQSSASGKGLNSFAQTGIDRVAGLYVKGSTGTLVASAGRDLQLTAAALRNAGAGDTQLSAGQDLKLNTVTTSSSQNIVWDANNRLSMSQSQDVGSQITAGGKLTLIAGNDLIAKAAQVNAGQALNVSAGHNVNITVGQASQSLDEAHKTTSSGLLSSSTTTTRNQLQSTTAVASNFEGQSMSISAGQDLNVKGSNVLADQSVSLNAGGNVRIEAAQNTQSQSNFRQETKSGLMSSGGIGFTVGSRMQSVDQQGQSTTAAGSTVGSTGGNVTINAGRAYTQTGSDVLTPNGDIAITAKKVDIKEARETGSQSTEQKFKQSGITLAVTSPVISALQGVQQQAQAAGNTGSDRMKALAAANAAMQVKQGASQVQDALSKGDATGGAGISVSLGSSSSQSNSQSSADNAKGSNLSAGGNIQIQATGAGTNSNITVQGSDIKAVGTTALKADNQVQLLAAANTTQETSANKSSSASIGLAISTQGVGVTASASKATGQGAGNGTTFTNTHVEGGQQVVIQSGADTTLKGATVTGHQITAQVGGDLNVQSLQDQSQYNEKSQSAGGSVMVGITSTGPASGNLNLGKTSINSTYTSVNEQSAIRAGDVGFNVSVNGKTTLTGGQITSTQAAVDNNKNSYEAKQGTTTTDLNNSASYSANNLSVGLGAGALPGQSLSAGMSGVGLGKDSGSVSSVTTAGISGVAGNTSARTGDASTSINPIFNKDQVKQEVTAQVAITSEFGKQASKEVGAYAQKQYEKALAAGDQTGIDVWKEGGSARVAMHAVIGGLTGGTAGAAGSGAGSAAAPAIDQLQSQLQDGLQKAGLGADTSKVIASLASGATAAGIGAAASGGSTAGAATAFNADMNNRQIGAQERNLARNLSDKAKASGLTKADGSAYTQADIENAMRNSGKGNDPVTTGMLVDPSNPNAITDKGASFTSNDGKTLVQVNKDGSNLGANTIDPKLAAYIVQETGGANTPYKDLLNQLEAAKKGSPSNPNLGLNTITPAVNGCVTSECAAGVLPVTKPNDAAAALVIGPAMTAGGAVTGNPALIGAGVNLTSQGIKATASGNTDISVTEAVISGATGSLGAAVTEVKAVGTIIQQGGAAATATNATIGAATNVIGDTATKAAKGEEITAVGAVQAAGAGGAGSTLFKNPVLQNITTEIGNALPSPTSIIEKISNTTSSTKDAK